MNTKTWQHDQKHKELLTNLRPNRLGSRHFSLGRYKNHIRLKYIYQLKPVKVKGKPRHHEVVERFALPTWQAYNIEQRVFRRFAKYRVQYYPSIETKWYRVIIKVGISNNPQNRVNSINRDPKSGYTEYLEVGFITYIRLVTFIFRLWFFYTVFLPAFLLAFFIILILIV